jgi:hypothetical protein
MPSMVRLGTHGDYIRRRGIRYADAPRGYPRAGELAAVLKRRGRVATSLCELQVAAHSTLKASTSFVLNPQASTTGTVEPWE